MELSSASAPMSPPATPTPEIRDCALTWPIGKAAAPEMHAVSRPAELHIGFCMAEVLVPLTPTMVMDPGQLQIACVAEVGHEIGTYTLELSSAIRLRSRGWSRNLYVHSGALDCLNVDFLREQRGLRHREDDHEVGPA